MKKLLSLILIAAIAVVFSSCKEDEEPFVHVESVSFDVDMVHLNPGKTCQVAVTILPENATNKKIAWYCSNTNVATVDESGVVTALAFGDVILTAEANDMHVNATVRLLVDDQDNSIPITKLMFDVISKDFNFATDPNPAPLQITPSFEPADATNRRFTWSSSDPLVASVDAAGLVTPLSHGKTTITATTNDGGNQSASCEIAVVGIKERNYDSGDDYYKIIYYPVNITVKDAEGKDVVQTWLDRNLGAKKVPTSFNDYEGYGSLFQWSRKADGHEKMNWTSATAGKFVNAKSATTPATSRVDAGTDGFVTGSNANADWCNDSASQRDGLWGGRRDDNVYAAPLDDATQINNPCPVGYRVPTVSELEAMTMAATGLTEMVYNVSNPVANANSVMFDSPLKLPCSGHSTHTYAPSQASRSVYWANRSTSDGAAARLIVLQNKGVYISPYGRANAYAVRCIRNTPLANEVAEIR